MDHLSREALLTRAEADLCRLRHRLRATLTAAAVLLVAAGHACLANPGDHGDGRSGEAMHNDGGSSGSSYGGGWQQYFSGQHYGGENRVDQMNGYAGSCQCTGGNYDIDHWW